MKITIPTNDRKTIYDQFGRAQYFAVYDTDAKTYTYIDNSKNHNAAQGAGIQAATDIVNHGTNALITSHLGPKAFDVIRSAGIKVFSYKKQFVQLESVVDDFLKNTLTELTGPNR